MIIDIFKDVTSHLSPVTAPGSRRSDDDASQNGVRCHRTGGDCGSSVARRPGKCALNRVGAIELEAAPASTRNNNHLAGGSPSIYARSPEHCRSELNERYSSSAGLSASRSPWIKEGPSIRAFQRTKVLSERRSSRSGREQLPVLRQNYLIDCMNDAVRRDEIRPRDADSINPYV
jgi:hypothetical protein